MERITEHWEQFRTIILIKSPESRQTLLIAIGIAMETMQNEKCAEARAAKQEKRYTKRCCRAITESIAPEMELKQ